MTDDQRPGDDPPPVPPVAGGDGDPTLPGGADPTIAQPVQPHYTTGPGEPPARVGAASGVGGVPGGGGDGVGGGTVPPPGSGGPERPAWLLPAAGGLAAGLVVALLAFFVLSGDDGGDELASTDSTIPTVVETTVPPDDGEAGTEPPATTVAPDDGASADTTVAPDDDGDVVGGTNTTLAPDENGGDDGGGSGGGEEDGDGGASTGGDSADGGGDEGSDGGESTDPCAGGYTEVTSLPFGVCSQGDVVADAQFTLSEFVAIDVDGFYGPTSFSAVQEIQRSLGLEPDGVVSAELIDALIGSVPATEFTVATPGTVRVVDREYPIARTCRTIPLAGFTADYVVISYVFVTDFGVEVVDRWFEEGLATGAFYFGQELPVTELDAGFGLEIVEGDSLVTITVNPVDAPTDSCVGLVTEFGNSGAQSRLYSVLDVCAASDGLRLLLSENATVDITETGDSTAIVQFVSGTAQPFLFGEDPNAVVVDDGSTSTANATIDAGEGVRSYLIQYPSSPSRSC